MRDGEITATAELDLSALGLKEYELVAYHAEATDNNTLDGPGVGESPVYFVEITNEEGKPCLSQGQGQRVNLLVIQKQIIADSTALAPKAKAEEFDASRRVKGTRLSLGNCTSMRSKAAALRQPQSMKCRQPSMI